MDSLRTATLEPGGRSLRETSPERRRGGEAERPGGREAERPAPFSTAESLHSAKLPRGTSGSSWGRQARRGDTGDEAGTDRSEPAALRMWPGACVWLPSKHLTLRGSHDTGARVLGPAGLSRGCVPLSRWLLPVSRCPGVQHPLASHLLMSSWSTQATGQAPHRAGEPGLTAEGPCTI